MGGLVICYISDRLMGNLRISKTNLTTRRSPNSDSFSVNLDDANLRVLIHRSYRHPLLPRIQPEGKHSNPEHRKCPRALSKMSLASYVNKKVCVLTTDSRTLVGTLLSCDQTTNLVLGQTIERIIRPPEDPEASSEVAHGLYLIRGDNVVVVGLVEEELDQSINWGEVRGAVIGGVKHS